MAAELLADRETVLAVVSKTPVLRALFETDNTEVRPRPMVPQGVSINIEPLIELAGDDVVALLEAQVEDDETLENNANGALRRAIASHAMSRLAPTDVGTEPSTEEPADLQGGQGSVDGLR